MPPSVPILCLISAAVAFTTSAVGTAALVSWTRRQGIVDPPNTGFHRGSTPRGGGLAIVAVVLVTGLVVWAWIPTAGGRLAGCLVPALAVAVVSWMDDVRSLSPGLRLAVHVGGAGAATALLGPAPGIALGPAVILPFGAAGWPLTLLWIVGLTNAFNFMDGSDGIAGLSASVAAAALAGFAAACGSLPQALLATAFSAAALGFLTCNWQPARIFLGDVGSTWCGFLVAVLPLTLPAQFVPGALAVAAAAAWPFVFDTSTTLLRRLAHRENILRPHRSHLYQRLVIAGWSHRATAGLYAGLGAATAAAMLLALLVPGAAVVARAAAAATVGLGMVGLPALVWATERDRPLAEGRPAGSRG